MGYGYTRSCEQAGLVEQLEDNARFDGVWWFSVIIEHAAFQTLPSTVGSKMLDDVGVVLTMVMGSFIKTVTTSTRFDRVRGSRSRSRFRSNVAFVQ
jgi:predicted permease